MNPDELREEIIRPVINGIFMGGLRAEEMLLGIAAVESNMCENLVSPHETDLGPWQIERGTFTDIMRRYLKRDDKWKLGLDIESVCDISINDSSFNDLKTNFKLGCALARIRLWWVPEELPPVKDVLGMARYWKSHYNTAEGKGCEKDFIQKYKHYVKGEA